RSPARTSIGSTSTCRPGATAGARRRVPGLLDLVHGLRRPRCGRSLIVARERTPIRREQVSAAGSAAEHREMRRAEVVDHRSRGERTMAPAAHTGRVRGSPMNRKLALAVLAVVPVVLPAQDDARAEYDRLVAAY